MNLSLGILRFSANRNFTCFFVTYTNILSSLTHTTCPYGQACLLLKNAPLPLHIIHMKSITSVPRLAPFILQRKNTWPVSYYAFFKGWLLLSQPPGCLCIFTSFTTQRELWDLSWWSGFFPSRLWSLAPTVRLLQLLLRYSELAKVW